jgi:hypothetical protein
VAAAASNTARLPVGSTFSSATLGRHASRVSMVRARAR